ncbi:MAG: GNAT family N-acetyltransferase [Flavobacteriales bacterium]
MFLSYDWITSTCSEDAWGVALSGNSNDLKGFLLYFIKRKHGFRRITLPPLTPYLGPWIIYPEGQKRSQRYAHEKKVMEDLIEQLPPYDDLVLQFHPRITNSLPFYWKGFANSLRYTYVIEALSEPEQLFSEFRGNTRRAIRKASEKLEVTSSDEIETLHRLKLKDYKSKGKELPYSFEYFQRIDAALASRSRRKILYAVDGEEKTHGGIYLVYDQEECYYLIGAVDPEVKNEGSMSLLMWKGIEEASAMGLAYNFEGSMIEPIERFFRSFGAVQVPYLRITKTPSFLLRGWKAFQSLSG